jgi:glycosyltransferase 2 family protein
MKLGWRGVLGIALSAALLWWTLRDVSLPEVWAALSASNLPLLVASALVATLAFPLRAWRWRYILYPVAPSLPYGPLWRSTAIGMMVNNVVPARAGELARAFALSRERQGVGFAAALGSLVVDRVMDALAILVLLLIVVVSPEFPRSILVLGKPVDYWLRVAATIAVASIAILALLAFLPGRMLAIWDGVAGRVSPRLAERGRGILTGFTQGVGVFRDPTRFGLVLFWTMLQWVVNGLSFWMGMKAVGIDAGVPAAFFLQSMLALAVALPSAPGFFGIFEAVSKASLAVYGIDGTLAVSFALGYHLLSFIPITIIGFWYFVRLGMHFSDLQG